MKTKLSILIIIFGVGMLFGQKTQIRLADKLFNQFGYIKASELYKEALTKNDTNSYVLARLGDCFYKNSDVDDAVFWYRKWYDQSAGSFKSKDSTDLLKFAYSLHSKGVTNIALDVLGKYNSVTGRSMALNPDLILRHIENISTNILETIEIENLEFNSQYSDFGSFVHNGKLYFASSRVKADSLDQKYQWNEQPFLDIYEVFVGENDAGKTYSQPDTMAVAKVNTAAHEASVAITNDGKTMYFTRDNLDNKDQLQYDEKGTSNLKLCRASLIDDKWVVTEEDKNAFNSINDDNYSTGGPALSPDNQRLYFVSDAPHEGARGQTDLYYVDIIENNGNYAYGVPKNLGKKINTDGREMFPHISKDGTFYFSSDAIYYDQLGLGLLDIYKTTLDDEYAVIENMMAPFNSKKDDFAIYIDELQDDTMEIKSGYFSSNRDDHPDARGDDDIYSFSVYKCEQTVRGVVKDSLNMRPLADALVELIDDASGKIISSVTVDASGAYEFSVECDRSYTLKGSKSGYSTDLERFTTSLIHEEVNYVDLILNRFCEIKTEPILFDFDKWNIRADAEYRLDPVLEVLLNDRSIKIRIESHTDSRGTDGYNEILSIKRANSTKEYLLSKGVEENQIISAIGFGEYQVCFTDAQISSLPTKDLREDAHEKNRRSRFIIDGCGEGSGCPENMVED